jgi:hypothetical protein
MRVPDPGVDEVPRVFFEILGIVDGLQGCNGWDSRINVRYVIYGGACLANAEGYKYRVPGCVTLRSGQCRLSQQRKGELTRSILIFVNNRSLAAN